MRTPGAQRTEKGPRTVFIVEGNLWLVARSARLTLLEDSMRKRVTGKCVAVMAHDPLLLRAVLSQDATALIGEDQLTLEARSERQLFNAVRRLRPVEHTVGEVEGIYVVGPLSGRTFHILVYRSR